jgi:Flp pilus assembly protein TadD
LGITRRHESVRDSYFRKAVFFGLTVIMAVPVVCLAALMIHTVQTGSFGSVERAERQFDLLEGGLQEADLEHLRIEKIGNYYTVRIGCFDTQADVDSLLRDVRSLIGSAITMTAYYREERIVKLHGASLPLVSVPTEDTKEKVKDEVSPVRADTQVTELELEQPPHTAQQDDGKTVETAEATQEQDVAGEARSLEERHALFASLVIRDKNYKKALSIIQSELDASSDSPDLHGWYGVVLLKMDRPGEAIEHFRKAVVLSPGVLDYHNGSGYCLFYLHRLKEAIIEFNMAISLDPMNIDALSGLGMSYAMLGRKEEAMNVFTTVRDIDSAAAEDLLRVIER